MVRSSWNSAVVLLMAWAGLASGQQPSPPACTSCTNAQFVTVHESGQPAQQCRVLACWRMTNGKQACQVQSVQTGEKMTIIDFVPPHAVPNATTGDVYKPRVHQVYRWGNSKTCPPGFPEPPTNQVVHQTAEPGTVPSATPYVPCTPCQGSVACQCQCPPCQQQAEVFPSGCDCQCGPVVQTPQRRFRPFQFFRDWRSQRTSGDPWANVASCKPCPTPDGIRPVRKYMEPPCNSDPRLMNWPPAHQTAQAAPPRPTLSELAQKSPMPKGKPVSAPVRKKTGTYKDQWSKRHTKTPPSQKPRLKLFPNWGKSAQVAKAKNVTPSLPKQPVTKVVKNDTKVKTKPSTALPPPPPTKIKPVTKKSIDPIDNPAYYASKEVKKQLPKQSTMPPAPPSYAMEPGNAGTGRPMPQMGPNGLPPGSASVMAARMGLESGTQMLPYPVVTVPSPNRPPVPPPPTLPQAPQPNMYVNAFSPRHAPNMNNGHPPYPANMRPPYPNGPYPPQMGGYPYPPQMAGYPYPPQMGGYPQPPMMPYPPQHARMPYPPNPYMQPNMMAQMQRPMGSPSAPFQMARMYPGPMPPNPNLNGPIHRVGYQPPMPQGYPMPMPYANPAMDRPGVPLQAPNYHRSDAVQQMLVTLKTAVSPSQREWAVLHLAMYEWQRHPEIVQGLLVGSKEDPASTVRAACVRAMMRMKIHPGVIGPTLQSLKTDSSKEVRQAAHTTMVQMGMASKTAIVASPTATTKKTDIVPVSRKTVTPVPNTSTPQATQPAAPAPRPAAATQPQGAGPATAATDAALPPAPPGR